jgi:hypothetical protein
MRARILLIKVWCSMLDFRRIFLNKIALNRRGQRERALSKVLGVLVTVHAPSATDD